MDFLSSGPGNLYNIWQLNLSNLAQVAIYKKNPTEMKNENRQNSNFWVVAVLSSAMQSWKQFATIFWHHLHSSLLS